MAWSSPYFVDRHNLISTQARVVSLSRHELDDDIYIDRQADIAGAREADRGGPQRLGINCDPIGNLLTAAVADHTFIQIVNLFLRANRDHVAWSKLVTGAGDLDAVD